MSNKRSNASIQEKKGKRECSRCHFRFEESRLRCPSCGAWNFSGTGVGEGDGTILLSDVAKKPKVPRLLTGPWDPCFGEPIGIARDGVFLLGGEPGAGKSTMSLQLADAIAASCQNEVLYIAAEESEDQVDDRAARLELNSRKFIRIYPLGCKTDLTSVIMGYKPSAIIFDSISGLVESDQEAAVSICKNMKEISTQLRSPTIVISHVNKQDDFAGLMALQHAVDCTISLFSVDLDDDEQEELEARFGRSIEDKVRELRTQKNRYGPANRTIDFAMTETGLVHIPDDEEDDEDED